MRYPLPTSSSLLICAFLVTVGVLSTVVAATADELPGGRAPADFLPPVAAWDGRSRELALAAEGEWATPCEASGLTRSPSYAETMSWLRRLAAASPDLDLVSIGDSAEGREIVMVVAARGVAPTPEALLASGRPIVLVQAGIHAGEIDGKDAGMMLLRDMTVRAALGGLLDRVSLLLVPILNVDGHERVSRFNRANQRGPEVMGWRTNARNLNLNRDYAKLDTAGVRAIVAVIERWQPDLYLDLHVTDGADYQYDVTWGTMPETGWSPAASRWINEVLAPAVDRDLEAMGHVPGPFIFAANGEDLAAGNSVWMASPRFSHGYGAARHLATVLVENHSLKPFDRRVLATRVFLQSVLEVVGARGAALREANSRDRRSRPDPVVLSWRGGDEASAEVHTVKAIRSERVASPVTGGEVVRWTGEPIDQDVVFHLHDVPEAVARRPVAYFMPAAWADVADVLRRHGIEVQRLSEPIRVQAEVSRLPGAAVEGNGEDSDGRVAAYEGRVRITPGPIERSLEPVELPAGSFRVDTDQPLGTLAVLLLEPEAPDSLFQWGFFLEVLQRTEYVEDYVMEPLARAMLDADPQLAAEFDARLADDPGFAADERARLRWFDERSPFSDGRYRRYPVVRVIRE